MTSVALVTAVLASLVAPAQESVGDELWEPSSYRELAFPTSAPAPELPALLPLTLAAAEPTFADPVPGFSIGAAGGYMRAREADRGTWFGGVQARLRLLGILAAEAAITFHQNRFENNDIIVTQYPVQLSAMLFIIPEGPIRPYILGGVGWYYTRIDFHDGLSSIDDETDHVFGWHFGAGGELFLGPRVSLNVDVRYIFLEPDTDQVSDRDFNYWHIAFGLNFYF